MNKRMLKKFKALVRKMIADVAESNDPESLKWTGMVAAGLVVQAADLNDPDLNKLVEELVAKQAAKLAAKLAAPGGA
jgi:hypothetical protein